MHGVPTRGSTPMILRGMDGCYYIRIDALLHIP